MNSRSLRALSRDIVRELGVFSKKCGKVDLSPVEAHILIELEQAMQTNLQLAERLRIDKSNISRTLQKLAEEGLIQWQAHASDKRSKQAALTLAGRDVLRAVHAEYDVEIECVLQQLDSAEQQRLQEGLDLYRQALNAARAQQGYQIRLMAEADNAALAAVIRQVSAEHGLSEEQGYGVADPHLDQLYPCYQQAGAAYWVIQKETGALLGGAGIAPLAGADTSVCELQKMYLLNDCRGLGLGKRLLMMACDFAKRAGYQQCYLETTASLPAALALYTKMGFRQIAQPMGETGHHSCEIFMLRDL
ncbi:MAG: bifunctional helix-turn-helix transcriptional regulator/GNAT family N-acetyltransferase [Proteobacteria bacterium]|nr:bifunctional helix-turn-helix transcriptional regulator/GNAT family N-acetyltransferase [Pseudomonadota bacterium]